jgi:oxaloacetate decarboxylase alpha subunit
MSEIHFIDTTLRDGNQSLWALNMPIGAMLPIAEQMDKAGFESMEFFVSTMFKKYVHEHKVNPWDWIRLGSKRFIQTRLRYHGSMHGIFDKTPICILRLLIERMVSYGITLTRDSNCWNDYESFKREIDELSAIGMQTVANLIYTVSPRHTDEYFARKAREAAAMKPYRICFKDVGGLLTPERARTLIPIIQKNIGTTPLEFHAHCNTGQAPLCYMEAVKLGIRTLHTGVPPLANGSALPSIFNIASNVRSLGHTPCVDEKVLEPVRDHFTAVAKKNGFPIGMPREYDHSLYLHQIPGGMISNLRHQLKIAGLENKMEQVLEEAARVRAEFGYPIMVTPLSQFVGVQATINVITGERYKEVIDQVLQYALGIWGEEATQVMDPDIRAKILDRPRAKEWERWTPPEPSLAEVRRRFSSAISDEELILRFYAGDKLVDALQHAGRPREFLDGKEPIVKLIEKINECKGCNHIYLVRPGFSLRLERHRRQPIPGTGTGGSAVVSVQEKAC